MYDVDGLMEPFLERAFENNRSYVFYGSAVQYDALISTSVSMVGFFPCFHILSCEGAFSTLIFSVWHYHMDEVCPKQGYVRTVG